MINIKIILNKLSMPKPKIRAELDLKQKAKMYIDCIEKNQDKDSKHWLHLKQMYKDLTVGSLKKDPCREMLLKFITPTIQKYMQYDNSGVPLTTEYLTESSK